MSLDDRLKSACFTAAEFAPDATEAPFVERAAELADEWYEANPMPMGNPAQAEAYHQMCHDHVVNQVRVGCGLFAMMSIFATILSICHTVWAWRREANQDKSSS